LSRVGEIELAFSNAVHQFDAGDRNGRVPKALEVEHRIDSGLETSFSGALRISTAIEMVNLEVVGCVRRHRCFTICVTSQRVFIVMGC
jgi:hypothetical protein